MNNRAVEDQPVAANLSRFWKFPKSWKEVRSLGWKFIAAFILFYLIRDLILYVLLPYLIYQGVISY